MSDETNRLFQVLNDENLESSNLSSAIGGFSVETKDAVVNRSACTIEPPLSGRLLERLPQLLNDGNRKDMAHAFIANLGSPDAEARRYSLRGLAALQDPALADFALVSLRDEDSELVYESCKILLRSTSPDSRVAKILKDLYRARKNQKDFKSTLDLLKSQGLTDQDKL